MKLLIENWRSFVNEEDQKEGETSVTQADIDALFDDHASGRPFDAETEKVLDIGATINEVEATEEGYDVVLQDFIVVHNNISDALADENSSIVKAYMNLAHEKEEWLKVLGNIKSAVERDARNVSWYSQAIQDESWNNEGGAFYGQEEKVKAGFELENNSYLKNVTRLIRYLQAIERIFSSAFGTDTNKIDNYHKAVSAIKLFTGESVATVRKPETFKSDQAKIISNSDRMLKNIVTTLRGLDIIPRPYLDDYRAVYDLNNKTYLDLKAKISSLTYEERPTKSSYEFANGFLTYAGKNSPVSFIQQGTEIYRGVNVENDKYTAFKNMTPGTVISTYHDIVSWTTDRDIAMSFAMGEGDTRTANPHAVLLRTKATRGLYVEEYSKFPNEKEIICGGNMVLVEVNTFRLPDFSGTMREGLVLDFEYK